MRRTDPVVRRLDVGKAQPFDVKRFEHGLSRAKAAPVLADGRGEPMRIDGESEWNPWNTARCRPVACIPKNIAISQCFLVC